MASKTEWKILKDGAQCREEEREKGTKGENIRGAKWLSKIYFQKDVPLS